MIEHALSGRKIPCPKASFPTINVPCLRMSYSLSIPKSINLTVPIADLWKTTPATYCASTLYVLLVPEIAEDWSVKAVTAVLLFTMLIPATLITVPSE